MSRLRKRKNNRCLPAQGRDRFCRHSNKNPKELKQTSCYSLSGFLVDILEHYGFRVRCIESYGPGCKEFRIDVQLAADKKGTEEMLQYSLEENIRLKNKNRRD